MTALGKRARSERGRPGLNFFGWLLLVLGVLLAAFAGIFTLFFVSGLFAGGDTGFALNILWLPLILGGLPLIVGLGLAFAGGAMVRAAKPVDPRDFA